MEQILSNKLHEEVGLVLMGNKCDMEPRSVTEEMGKKLAEILKIDYYETSALNGQGIKEAFEALIRDIMKKKGVGEGNNDGGGVSLNGKKIKDKKDSDYCK